MRRGGGRLICLPIVTTTLKVTRIMVNSKYFPSRGTARDVGGIISARRRKNTVSERRIEMERLTFSPESEGR